MGHAGFVAHDGGEVDGFLRVILRTRRVNSVPSCVSFRLGHQWISANRNSTVTNLPELPSILSSRAGTNCGKGHLPRGFFTHFWESLYFTPMSGSPFPWDYILRQSLSTRLPGEDSRKASEPDRGSSYYSKNDQLKSNIEAHPSVQVEADARRRHWAKRAIRGVQFKDRVTHFSVGHFEGMEKGRGPQSSRSRRSTVWNSSFW